MCYTSHCLFRRHGWIHPSEGILVSFAFYHVRHNLRSLQVVADLKNAVQSLNFPQRSLPQDFSKTIAAIPCCKVLQKPAEKILLRYGSQVISPNAGFK